MSDQPGPIGPAGTPALQPGEHHFRISEKAEAWLKTKGVDRVLAPVSMSIWEEPGLLIKGHDHRAGSAVAVCAWCHNVVRVRC